MPPVIRLILLSILLIILIRYWWTPESYDLIKNKPQLISTAVDIPLIENVDLPLAKGTAFVDPRVAVKSPAYYDPRSPYEARSRMIASTSPDKIYWQVMGGYWL